MSLSRVMVAAAAGVGVLACVWAVTAADRPAGLDPRVLAAESERVAAVERVRPTVVAVFAAGGQGGGSGVLISKDGYALTNFHVVEGSGPVMQCGLPDGVLYDAVLVGLDKVGDVALIKLVPKQAGKDFPFAPLGDSDKVRAGDWSLAMGNPFLLATDFNPTVTYGLVSGVHRYQYPAGTLLEYTDCIQIDTSINPGNSGGPLFNMQGELIGINGRGSFEKRGRVNSGVGYAISINQIKNFMGHLRAGLDADHATLGAEIKTDNEEGSGTRLLVGGIIESSDAARRKLDEGDELVSFAGRPMTSVNQYKNVLGLFPRGWRVPLVYRKNNEKHEVLVRLMQLQQTQTADDGRPKPRPGPPQRPTPPRSSAATRLYEPKPGFANYYFNRLERDRLLAAFRAHGDFTGLAGDWSIEGQAEGGRGDLKVAIREELDERDAQGRPVARETAYHLRPSMLPALPLADARTDSAPLRKAIRHADEMLRKHAKSFPQEFWVQSDEAAVKEQIFEVQKNVAAIQGQLQDVLEDLKKAGAVRGKEESLVWRAHYDYTVARLTSFLAYLHEYNYLLGQVRKENMPKRNAKVHRGWRMEPDDTLRSGGEARALAAEAARAWDKMARDYRGTRWEDLAAQARRIKLGVHWVPTGGTRTAVRLSLGGLRYQLDPLKEDQDVANLKEPAKSGGLLEAFYQYRRLLTLGTEGAFEAEFSHGGYEPWYPPRADGKVPASLNDLRVDCEILRTEHAAVPVKWYFDRKDHRLLGFEVWVEKEDDPCEVYLSDYRSEGGRMLPHRMEVRYGNDRFGAFTINAYQLAASR